MRSILARVTRASVCLLLSLAAAAAAQARCQITVSPGENVREAFAEAMASSCSVHLLAGEHVITARLGVELNGTAQDPAVISGEGSATTHLHRPNRQQNIIDLSGNHVDVRDLTFTGGDRGIRLERSSTAVRFERIVVHGTGDAAFTANTPGATYRDIVIRGSEFYDTNGFGECLYLGCNKGACTFSDAQVLSNYCHDTHSTKGRDQGDGLDLKGGSEAVLVRNNVFVNTHGLGILAYANGGKRRNIFEGNVILNRQGGRGIQVTGDAHLRNNVVILENVKGEAGIVGSPNNQGIPDNLVILHNTVVRRGGVGRCMTFRGWQGDAPRIIVANNAVYCPEGEALYVADEPQLGLIASNAIQGTTNLTAGTFAAGAWADELVAPFTAANAYPRAGASLLGTADVVLSIQRDFNCRARRVPSDVGAYGRIEADNIGWTGADTFKHCAAPRPSLPPLPPPRLPPSRTERR
ncbi:MAG: right-handed parallel beta-helix repeat-containing protein [Pseudomonadota bacterium]